MSDYDDNLPSLRQTYDHSAGQRQAGEIAPWKQEERARYLALLQAAGARTLLEIGAGPGKDAAFFAAAGLEVVCTDLSPQMVALCRAKGLEAHVMDFLHLDFAPGRFDAVYALNCLLHLPKEAMPAVLARLGELLRPGGLLFLGQYGGRDSAEVWANDPLTPQRFFSFYTDDGLQTAVAPYFAPLDFHAVELPDLHHSGLHFQSLTARVRPSQPPAPGGV